MLVLEIQLIIKKFQHYYINIFPQLHKQGLNLKHNYSKYHKVNIILNDKNINCIGYVDTGNKAVDPYLKRRIIFI